MGWLPADTADACFEDAWLPETGLRELPAEVAANPTLREFSTCQLRLMPESIVIMLRQDKRRRRVRMLVIVLIVLACVLAFIYDIERTHSGSDSGAVSEIQYPV